MAPPYHFIKHGTLFAGPIRQPEVPYHVQALTKPRDFSLWVNGKVEEPAFQLDNARMPPSMYQEVRNDLVRFSPVEVSRSAFCRSNHAYTGVIDSKGKPYYFALDGRGISVREVSIDDDKVWKTFDRLADEERAMATRKRRSAADVEMKQIDRELSKPQLVIMKGFAKEKEDGTPIKKPSLYQKLRGLTGKPRTDITPEGDPVKPQLPTARLLTKAEAHTGTMVALHLPPEIAEQIAISGGEDPSSMHITLAYLGKDLTEEQKSNALCAVRRFAQQSPPIKALLGGVGRFSASVTSEGNDVVYLSVDSPDITRLRTKLLEELAAEGIEPSNAHGFVPHVTLMYVATTARTPVKRFPPLAVEFPGVSLTVADQQMYLPFTQNRPALVIEKSLHPHAAWAANELKAGRKVTHENGTRAYGNERRNSAGKMETTHYTVVSPNGMKTTHHTAEEAGAAAHAHTKDHKPAPPPKATASFKKALPKKPKEEKVKKTPSKGASKKQVGAGGKPRYTYPKEKIGAGGRSPKAKQQPLLVVRHDDSKNADPSEFANQLGVSIRTIQQCAKRLGREGFTKFMRSRLKRFSAKHRIDPDYWGTLYEKLQTGSPQ